MELYEVEVLLGDREVSWIVEGPSRDSEGVMPFAVRLFAEHRAAECHTWGDDRPVLITVSAHRPVSVMCSPAFHVFPARSDVLCQWVITHETEVAS